MKKIFASMRSMALVLFVLVLSVTFGCILNINIFGQSDQDTGNKQYVQVKLKNGKVINFEYRSFMEMNLKLQPYNGAAADEIMNTNTFGENRFLFREKDSCQEQSISLDNLQEMECLGIVEDRCTQKKDWLYKVYLLDLDKYEGFFLQGEANLNKPMADQGLKGHVLNTTNSEILRFEDIKKITFFAR